MPRRPHICIEGVWVTDAAAKRLREAANRGFLIFNQRAGGHLRLAWRRLCIRTGSPIAELETRRDTAEAWADIWPTTPSFTEFPDSLRRQLHAVLVRHGIRLGAVSAHTVRANRVPLAVAESLMADQVALLLGWLRSLGLGRDPDKSNG